MFQFSHSFSEFLDFSLIFNHLSTITRDSCLNQKGFYNLYLKFFRSASFPVTFEKLKTHMQNNSFLEAAMVWSLAVCLNQNV